MSNARARAAAIQVLYHEWQAASGDRTKQRAIEQRLFALPEYRAMWSGEPDKAATKQ